MSSQRDLERRVRLDKSRPHFETCLPRSVKAPPYGDGWLHEIKHDGFRIIGHRDADGVCAPDNAQRLRLHFEVSVGRSGSQQCLRFDALDLAAGWAIRH